MDHEQQHTMSPVSSQMRDRVERKPIPITSNFQGRKMPDYSYQPMIHDDSPQASRAAANHPRSSAFKWWWIEILCSLGAMVCIAILAGLLNHYDGKPQPNWDKITLNTVVAAISTVTKTLFMIPVGAAISQGAWTWFVAKQRQQCRSRLLDLDKFDEASRGVWGSLKLLFKLRFIHLASIGAMITVLALGFDTFTQQLISYQDQLVRSNSSISGSLISGVFPRAEFWDEWQNGASLAGEFDTLYQTKAAIYNGILSEDLAPLPVSCTSGNCTWPIIPSLAICGECKSQPFFKSCAQGECTYTTSSGTSVTGIQNSFSEQTAFVVSTSTNGSGAYNISDETKLYLSVFDLFGAPYNGNDFNENTNSTECALRFCIQAYEISVNKTIQLQTAIHNWSETSAVSHSQGNISTNRNFTNIPSYMNTNAGSNYTISGLAITAYQENLVSILEGNVTAGYSDATFQYGNYFVQGVWNGSSDAHTWIKNLALSMTNNIRTMAATDNFADLYAGTAYFNESFVHVRWARFIFPVALVVLSTIFLLLSMIETARSGVGAWKGSPLWILFMDVDEGVKGRVGGAWRRKDGVRDVVGEEKVGLVLGGEGWRFANVD